MDFIFNLLVALKAQPHNRKNPTTVIGTVVVDVDVPECSFSELNPVAKADFSRKQDGSQTTRFFK